MTGLKEFLSPYLTGDVFALLYLLAGVLFILGIKALASPKTAATGNIKSMAGMALAVVVTFLHPSITDYSWIIAGIVAGALVGLPMAFKVKMTSMPEMVALFNAFVGVAATLFSLGAFVGDPAGHDTSGLVEIFMGAWIGAITFTGSIIAFGKLSGRFRTSPIVFKGQLLFNLGLILAMFVAGYCFVTGADINAFYVLTALALIIGIAIVVPIGGADMPVVVSMLNSYSGWATAATGFALNNTVLIIAGAIIGSSGAILSYIMCKAMNRSFLSVILGGFGDEADAEASAEKAAAQEKGVKEAATEDMAFMLENAERVIIVPGYGMAVAQAQHALREVMDLLHEKDVSVQFAVHPVAGRMPGHMNVLLAEADVSYDYVKEMDDINNEFAQTDVVIVVGANDVVNPDAKEDPSSPLYGMPILEAYKAKMVYVVKRSMRSGYAGIENNLFYMENTFMVFGDAKDVAERTAASLKE